MRRHNGFTLVELLAVIVILAIIIVGIIKTHKTYYAPF